MERPEMAEHRRAFFDARRAYEQAQAEIAELREIDAEAEVLKQRLKELALRRQRVLLARGEELRPFKEQMEIAREALHEKLMAARREAGNE